MSKDYDSEFEKTVLEYLDISYKNFNDFVILNGGYAQLLRNWIYDGFKNGQTPFEIARSIKSTPSVLEQLNKIENKFKN
ncbi:hypothetical protein [Aquimarina pacifica]|uniref:hypothetical protein n=1 Tax=Aquimarina pacifica TaxID=1296415 RepID=UPI000470FE75|nr:hypothetical protein [Aquimarina pacifica]